MRRTGSIRGWVGVAAIAAIGLMTSTSSWAAGGRLVFDVREPYQIGGQIYPAGPLQMRTVHDYTPSTKIQEIWAGERCLGMMFARRAHAEASPDRSVAVFRRSPQGHLVLLGYSVAEEDGGAVYRLAVNDGAAARAGADGGPDTLVMVALR